MKTFAPLLAAAAIVVAFGTQRIAGQRPSVLHVAALTATDTRSWDTFVTQASRDGALRLRDVSRDPRLPDRAIERFQQYHRGVPIWGADVVRDSERGVPLTILGEISTDLDLAVVPTLSADAVTQGLRSAGAPDGVLLQPPQLVILRLDSGEHRLTYTSVAATEEGVTRIFIDASSGGEVLRYSELQSQAAVGTGQGLLGSAKKLSTLQQGGTFFADDQLRPPVLRTLDMRGSFVRANTVLVGGSVFSADLASDADNTWTDVAVVDAHVHAGWTYDYYYKRFGRRGLDNRDKPIWIVTNAIPQASAPSFPLSVLDQWSLNAFWCPVCGPSGIGMMFFGNGIPAGYFDPRSGKRLTYFAGGLDVVAHELTHAVTSSSSNLVYVNQSGALNESFSDIMGTSVEFFFQAAGPGKGQADYLLGEDIDLASQPGTIDGTRSMANPGAFAQPDHYSRRYTGAGDNGGVHINSGIANHAFFLAIEGGTNRTSGLAVQGVGAANREQIENVFYRAFVFLLPSSATFSTARAATVQAARDLYGAGSAAERAVTQAWTAVGVL